MNDQIDDLTGLDMLIREYARYCAEYKDARAKTVDAHKQYDDAAAKRCSERYSEAYSEARNRMLNAMALGNRPSLDDITVFCAPRNYSSERARIAYDEALALEQLASARAERYQIELEAFMSEIGMAIIPQLEANATNPPPLPPTPPPNELFKKGA
jgi:glutathione S-transferase